MSPFPIKCETTSFPYLRNSTAPTNKFLTLLDVRVLADRHTPEISHGDSWIRLVPGVRAEPRQSVIVLTCRLLLHVRATPPSRTDQQLHYMTYTAFGAP